MATISANYRLFKENGEDPAFLKKSLEAKTQLEHLRNNIPYTYEGEFVEKTTDYVVLLRKLFNKDFHIYYWLKTSASVEVFFVSFGGWWLNGTFAVIQQAGLIKPVNPEMEAKRYYAYTPYYGWF